jgi:K+-transporting ATPase ATPase C chain
MRELRTALLVLLALTGLTGVAYPLVVTALAQVFLPTQARGSLVTDGISPRGSALVGQPFENPAYFWGRPSATARFPYDAAASSGSNLGPTNDALLDAVWRRAATLRAADPDNEAPIPVDLVTASASGLDPHLSPAAALWQAGRVARARDLAPARVAALIDMHTARRWLGCFGEPRVNVLELNLALDRATGR